MKRREFIKDIISDVKDNNAYNTAELKGNLDEYTGEWGKSQANHLLRRTLFGFRKNDLEKALTFNSSSKCIDELTKIKAVEVDPPVKFYDSGQYPDTVKVGETWVNSYFSAQLENERIAGLKAWWFGKMIDQDFNIREKMTLFWHNHFSTESEIVRVGVFHYTTNELFREYALGNFKELVKKVTLDPTMLFYLNGNENLAGKPNENFARELLELFTIGKGPLIGDGNYTNYTEEDIREAAKVLTGWNLRIRGTVFENELKFYSAIHDYSVKQFSSAFQNKTITPTGENEYIELINMIFNQDEVSRFIVRKIYKWFVYYNITEETETNIIEPLAKILRDDNYEIERVVKTLLKSNHFFQTESYGVMVKNPIDYVCGLVKNLELSFPTKNNPDLPEVTNKYLAWFNYGFQTASDLQLELFDPPSVAGWEAYYQTPTFYRIWISSATIQIRQQFVQNILSNRGLNRLNITLKASGIDFAETLSNPSDPNKLVNEMCDRLYPFDLTLNQKTILKLNIVDEGQGDYNWTNLWGLYQSNKNDQLTKATVETKLTNLLKSALELAEYQLS